MYIYSLLTQIVENKMETPVIADDSVNIFPYSSFSTHLDSIELRGALLSPPNMLNDAARYNIHPFVVCFLLGTPLGLVIIESSDDKAVES